VALRLLIEQVGQPGQLLAIQTSQPYLDLYFDPAGLWRLVETLFLEPARLPWSIGALLAIGGAVVMLRRAAGDCAICPTPHQATIFFALLFGVVFALFATIVGESWRNPRYLLFIQTYWLLLGAAGIVAAIAFVIRSPRGQAIAVGVASAAARDLDAGRRFRRHARTDAGLRARLCLRRRQPQPGDMVMTPQAAGCALVTGAPCDYYTQGRDFEPFVLVSGDRLIDRWSGATLLSTLSQLEAVLAQGKPVWFVTDGERLLKRFEDGFAREVLERFDVARDRRFRARAAFHRQAAAARDDLDYAFCAGCLHRLADVDASCAQ
jgi:hypothetical protein